MDFFRNEEHELVFFCEGRRRFRTLKNKQNPPKCRRQLFQEQDMTEENPFKEGKQIEAPPTKDWITCLKSCLDYDTTTSLNQFQSYLQFMNSCEEQTEVKATDTSTDMVEACQIVIDSETGKEFIVLNNMLQPGITYDNFKDKEVIVCYNKNNNNNLQCLLSPNIEMDQKDRHVYSDVMLSADDISNETEDFTSWNTYTPSSGLDSAEIMGCELEVDHEEVIQSISGSFDTLSCYSDDFNGSDEGFPEDFMDEF